ncbi:MAG: hypothetical protein M3N57_01765 [Actinomycetota bacterium]|nr:hypothetical protein [Actinomycetota bacterium]
MSAGTRRLEERKRQALRDLADVERQVADGEIDPVTATALRELYTGEVAEALDALDAAAEETPPARGPVATDRRRRRWMTGGVLVAAVATTALAVPRFALDRPDGGFVTGTQVGSPDVAAIPIEALEEVVADNPGVVGMRLLLADRYLAEDDLAAAFEHYRAVLDIEPHPKALARTGWLVFLDGQVDLAEQLLDASLQREPDDIETLWLSAYVALHGRGDAAAAAAIAEELLTRDDLGGDNRAVVEALLAQARQEQGR